MRRFAGSQDGQTAAEYLGLLLVVAAIVAAIAQLGLPERLAAEVGQAICAMYSDDPEVNCPPPSEGALRAEQEGSSAERSSRGNAPRPGLAEVRPLAGRGVSARPISTQGRTRTVFASDGPNVDPISPEERQQAVCREGHELLGTLARQIAGGEAIRCRDDPRVPIIDIDRNGVPDHLEAARFRQQDQTDFNQNGVPDAHEPEVFEYRVNNFYRPGQPGVQCRPDPQVRSALTCRPYDEYFRPLAVEQDRRTSPGWEAVGAFVGTVAAPVVAARVVTQAPRIARAVARALSTARTSTATALATARAALYSTRGRQLIACVQDGAKAYTDSGPLPLAVKLSAAARACLRGARAQP